MATTEPAAGSISSKRWTQFYAAFQLATQRAAHKWTYKDFSECFPLWCEEQPNGAEGVFNTVSNFIESHIVSHTNKLFEQYDVQENIDALHAVVTEARLRQQRGETPGTDTWRADLEPKAAVRARTIPTLERERDLLRAQLVELENENMALHRELQGNVAAKDEADTKTAEIFALFDEAYTKWKGLPLEDMQAWTLMTAETQSAVNRAL
ncbi:hypothetical protein BC834DRAFT_819386 [Gloeopeniophorella convolvens]|nr:hypothetical protein BC834DRAFT_819386 [Gloeopeniophorella convolvens]